MALPPDLQLSQASLQDFEDCRRRFELRHLLRRAWPAVQVEPVADYERHLQQAALFHRLIQQQFLGVPVERLSAVAHGEGLATWWDNYLAAAPAARLGAPHPEMVLSAPLGDHRLMAKYDLILVTDGGDVHIFDWKTSQRRPGRQWLARRLQTRVYPYLLVEAGSHLHGGRPIRPEQVEMVYWFAEYPDQPERFAYDAAQHREDGAYLAALLSEMNLLAGGDEAWPLTPHVARCRFCVYRSLCDRGVTAGTVDEAEGDDDLAVAGVDLDIDFEQIAEIEF